MKFFHDFPSPCYWIFSVDREGFYTSTLIKKIIIEKNDISPIFLLNSIPKESRIDFAASFVICENKNNIIIISNMIFNVHMILTISYGSY